MAILIQDMLEHTNTQLGICICTGNGLVCIQQQECFPNWNADTYMGVASIEAEEAAASSLF